MIAQCCKTCVHSKHIFEKDLRQWCECHGHVVDIGDCCADHRTKTGETYAPRGETETWQCIGCPHMCRTTIEQPYIPTRCHVHDEPLTLPNGNRVGDAKWVRVNP